jgi:thioesterase domain-containing protein/acyl carrier protein
MVRWRADGNLEFLGRIDQQVKIRGFRIEFGEIESALLQHPQVAEAVVSVTDETSDKRLVAYYVAKGSPPAVAALRQFLKEKLPGYMVPGAFVTLDKLPMTPHGKVDRKALPAPPEQRRLADLVLPRTPTEEKLAQIWCEVLGVKEVGVHDNYFDLGGHSLKAVWLFQKVKQVFGKNLPMVTLFQAPTVAQLAEVVQQEDKSASWSSLVPIKASGTRPPFFCIHGVGGNILEFLDLAKYMDEEQPFYGLQAVGLDGKRPWLQTVEEMAAHYIQEIRGFQPKGPYHLGGSSFGGLVAYEIAQQLRRQGEEVGLLVFFDTWAPGFPKALPSTSWFRKRLHYWQYRLNLHWSNLMLLHTAKERWKYARTKARKWVHGKRTQLAQFRHYCRQYYAERLVPKEIRKTRQFGLRAALAYVASPYSGRVTLFRATQQPKGIYPEPLLGWDGLVKGGIDVYDTPGHHGAIMRDPRARILAEQLKTALRKAHQNNRLVLGDSESQKVSHMQGGAVVNSEKLECLAGSP